MTTWEVEEKFPLADPAGLTERLIERGATLHAQLAQHDSYYAHPSRDFASTDEALRIRRSAATVFLTYKGPKLDSTTKTREEIEVAVPGGAAEADRIARLLLALGFTHVADVKKRRQEATLAWQGWQVHCALDDVEGLGRFIELEIVAAVDELSDAKAAIASLKAELGLTGGETRSYLELLLQTPNGTV